MASFRSPFRPDRNRNSGGIMLFFRNDIPAKVDSTDDRSIESFCVELNFRKKKCLIFKSAYFEEHLGTAASECRLQQQRRTTFAC